MQFLLFLCLVMFLTGVFKNFWIALLLAIPLSIVIMAIVILIL